jgi:hypothetical protein
VLIARNQNGRTLGLGRVAERTRAPVQAEVRPSVCPTWEAVGRRLDRPIARKRGIAPVPAVEINPAKIVREINRAGELDPRSRGPRQVDPAVVRQQVVVARLPVMSATSSASRDPSSRTCDRGPELARIAPESIGRKASDQLAQAADDRVFPAAKFRADPAKETAPSVPAALTAPVFRKGKDRRDPSVQTKATAPVAPVNGPTDPVGPVKANAPEFLKGSAPADRNAPIDPRKVSGLAVPANGQTGRIVRAMAVPTMLIGPGTTARIVATTM